MFWKLAGFNHKIPKVLTTRNIKSSHRQTSRFGACLSSPLTVLALVEHLSIEHVSLLDSPKDNYSKHLLIVPLVNSSLWWIILTIACPYKPSSTQIIICTLHLLTNKHVKFWLQDHHQWWSFRSQKQKS